MLKRAYLNRTVFHLLSLSDILISTEQTGPSIINSVSDTTNALQGIIEKFYFEIVQNL